MRERYSRLADSTPIFRTVRRGGGFLPPGHELPLPEWLEPTQEDARQAVEAGRLPGLSVWDAGLTSFPQACAWRQVSVSEQLAFSAEAGRIRRTAETHKRALDVVADPLDVEAPEWASVLQNVPEDQRVSLCESGQGHSLVEGISRPEGSSKKAHRDFRAALAGVFSPL